MPALEKFIQPYIAPVSPSGLNPKPGVGRPFANLPSRGRKQRARDERMARERMILDATDENTRIGQEIERRVGVPVMISATGPESAPQYKIIPLPGLSNVVKYVAKGRFLFPVTQKTFQTTRRVAPLPGFLGDMTPADDASDFYLGGFLDILKSAGSQIVKFSKKIIHPIRTIKTIRATRSVKRGITQLQAKGVSPVKGAVKTNSGKTILGDLLTLDNLMAAKALFPTGGAAETYQELLDNGQVVEAADMVETVSPGYFGGKPESKKMNWLIPAALIGGLYYAHSKKMI